MTRLAGTFGRMQSMSIRRKMDIILFLVLVLLPLGLLVVGHASDTGTVNNVLVVFLTVSVILFVPISKGFSHMLALRSIRELDEQCRRMKLGEYTLEELPPERGEEHDFMLLKRNLHWMGYAIASREKRLSRAMDSLADAQKQIVESIDYASLIQRSFLPDRDRFNKMFKDHCLLWDQRDKVGGDSYWFRETSGGFFVAVIDCTGHGVPGAFMTLIVHSLFEEAASKAACTSPAEVLGNLNRLVKDALGQNEPGGMSDDGLDCSLCFVDTNNAAVTYAGANNPLFILEAGEVRTVKGDRCGIGYVRSDRDFVFTDHEIEHRHGMRFFMTSDGIIDQVGGSKGFPFGKRRFKEFIVEHGGLSLRGQDRMLKGVVDAYRGDEPRRDDITVLGFEI